MGLQFCRNSLGLSEAPVEGEEGRVRVRHRGLREGRRRQTDGVGLERTDDREAKAAHARVVVCRSVS
jgi:hypothetical protein